jgi:hypothetical protein
MHPVIAAKFGVQIITGLGVSKIVSDIVGNNVIVTNTFDKVCVKAGTFVLGSIAWKATSDHIDQVVEDVRARLKDPTQPASEE